ncbi:MULTISPECIES: hydrogen peroxide-dependent heme synthase [Microbacterium]|uniref:Coproheme decarboxylase n=1 Tax=Microbacterium trichothecenolyticum TaxID=69370 RepID=A0A0M2HD06_MICTR|nr:MULTISPECIES: hydrogen peroxide-dependent heme synthase [Microbacterium]KJL41998.1 putative heme peroxidase [Microbacterium trichothecenolyticum]MDR7190979.1 chlorite dismutase [Microbacterium sp. BE35]
MTDPAANSPTETLGYTLWAVFRREPSASAPAGDLTAAVAEVEASGVTVRGFYDVSGLRADADLMIWLTGVGIAPEVLQSALRTLRRAEPLASLVPVWNAMGVHRDAEFTASHLPAFMRDKDPEAWLTVYPFVRSYDWYILPDDERRQMLADHGRKGAAHRSVLSNTVASFALGDYEWILALEAPELVELVDLMRDLRQTEARRHVREEVPFYTGRRIGIDEIAEVLA